MNNNTDFLCDKSGNIVTAFHGTYYDFDYFFPLSHFGNKSSAETVLKEGKWKRDKNIDITKPKIIPVHLKNGNYMEIPDLNNHYVDDWQAIILAMLLGKTIISDINNLRKWDDIEKKCEMASLKPLPYQYDFICEPINTIMNDDVIQQEMACESLYKKRNNENLFFQRMIRFFESIGIDGFMYKNFTESSGDNSYIIFRQNNVIRTDTTIPPMDKSANADKLKEIEVRFKGKYIPRRLMRHEIQNWIKKLHDFYDFRISEITDQKIKSNSVLQKNSIIK